MEAWNDGDRVRPIPIDDDAPDGAEHLDVPVDPAPDLRTRRPWLPMAIAVGAVVVVVGSVSIFGALRFDDPEPVDPGQFSANPTDEEGSTTTATTLPPRLEELLPGITDRLTIIAEQVEDDSAWALLWDPSFRIPKAVFLELESTPQSRLRQALFDSSGRFVAVEKCGALACDLHVGIPTDVGVDPDVEGTIHFAWHAAEVGRLAWVAPSSDGYRLMTASANPLSKGIDDVTEQFAFPIPFRIIRWDTEGFVIGYFSDDSNRTAGVTPEGVESWTIPGGASTATDDLVAAIVPDTGWTIVDRTTGEPLDNPGTPEELVFVAASDSADLVARLATREPEDLSLTVTGGSLVGPRIVTLEDRNRPLGFTANATYFLLLSGEEGVVFVDWERGAARTVEVPDGYRIIGIDVG